LEGNLFDNFVMIKEILFREEDLMTEEELKALFDMYEADKSEYSTGVLDEIRPENDPLELLGKNPSESKMFVGWGSNKIRRDDGDTLG
jgi:hypothetical protein